MSVAAAERKVDDMSSKTTREKLEKKNIFCSTYFEEKYYQCRHYHRRKKPKRIAIVI